MGKGYQNLEKGCPKRGIMEALGVQFFKYDHSNLILLQTYASIYLLIKCNIPK